MPFKKGHGKIGGRKRGVVNVVNRTVQEILARMDCDPFEGMAQIAINQLQCGHCRGTGRQSYDLPAGMHSVDCNGRLNKLGLCQCEGIGERKCLSCHGKLLDSCSPDLRGKMFAELAQYVGSKRKALEVSGPEGGPVEHEHFIKGIE